MIDQYEGWNREMLLELVDDLKARNAKLQEEHDSLLDVSVAYIDEHRQRIKELEASQGWRTLSESDLPRPFETFLLEWDGLWQRAAMNGVPLKSVTLYWRGDSHIIELDSITGRRWMRVPRLPKERQEQ